MEKKKFPFLLSGNQLKLLAALFMLIDHIGTIFYPFTWGYKYVGRLAFPIFAFFIAEGCRYTRNRLRYFLSIFCMAVVFQLVYYFVVGDTYLSIFVTFSIAILLVYLLDYVKKVFIEKKKTLYKILFCALFVLALVGTYLLNRVCLIDYGFWGCVTPLFINLFYLPCGKEVKPKWLDSKHARVSYMCIPLAMLCPYAIIPGQFHAFAALPLLLLYSGERGKRKLKYFFYAFYPAHLVILYAVYYCVYVL